MMSWIGFNKGGVIKIKRKEMQKLKQQALAAPLKRARLCLHKDELDPLQEMIIVLCKDSFVAPHQHKGKDESLHVVQGSFYLVIFNEHGRVIEKVLVKQKDHQGYLLCRVREGTWHTVIPRSNFVVIHEIIRGPFRRVKARKSDAWVPRQKAEIKKFINAVLTCKHFSR